MAEIEMTSLDEMFKEHDRLEKEIAERFQVLTRENSVMEIRNKMRALVDALKGNLVKEQDRRHRSEQDLKNKIRDFEGKVQPLERKCLDLEMELKEARRRAEADSERVRTLMEENHKIEREMETRTTLAELENARLKEKLDKCERECEHSKSVLKEENANLKTEFTKLGIKLASEEQKFRERMSYTERQTLRQQQEAELENARLKKELDKCEQDCEHSKSVLKEENANLKTEFARLGIKLATEEQKFRERMSEMERRTLRQQQENLDMNDKLAAAMRIIHDYTRKRALASEELSRVRARLDGFDREEINARERLERDLRQYNTPRQTHDVSSTLYQRRTPTLE